MKDHVGEATRSLFSTEARKTSVLCTLQFVGSALVVIGFFGPWIAHGTAALTVTGYELSEFAKFFPQVRSGAVPVRRALFIAPLLAGVVSLALVIQRSGRGRVLRVGATAVTALLLLVVLPPFQAILEPQYRTQLILIAVSTFLTLATPFARQLSDQVRGGMILLLMLLGSAPALWQVVLLRPLVAELYGRSVWPGWGLVICMVGFLALSLSSLRNLTRS